MSNMKNSAASKAGNKNRAKPSFRNTRIGVLPTTIESMAQLTVDPPTKVALTAASVKLTVEIDAAGTRVFLADQRTGQMVGGPEDLSKLGGIRAFVTRERREASGIEIARVITEIAYRAANARGSVTPGYVQQPLENSYGATVRPLLLTLERLEANRMKLVENTNDKLRRDVEPVLRDMFARIRNAYYEHIVALTAGESKKGQLAEKLFSHGVPEYVHTKFTGQAFVLDRSQELVRVLFPQDPSKGLALTVKEWRSDAFRRKVGRWMLTASSALEVLIRNDDFVRTITKIDGSVDLADETNPSVAKLLKARVHVVPPMKDSVYVTTPGSKIRGGWKFPSPTTETPAGVLTALGIAFLRVYSANLQSVDLVGDYYATILGPGRVTRQAVSPTNNFYVQWESSSDDLTWIESYTGHGTDGTLRAALWRWIRMELRFSEKGEAGQALARGLGLDAEAKPLLKRRRSIKEREQLDKDGKVVKPAVIEEVEDFPAIPDMAYPWKDEGPVTGLLNIQLPITPVEIPLVDEFNKVIFPKRKSVKSKVAQGANLTRLGPEAKYLIESVERLSKTLASRMTIWLRGFSDERLQAAASKLALAQFDELFIADEVDDDEDSSDEESNGGVDA